ncbi:heme-binding protein [Acidisphaera sp. S103]|uniref:heme-binding protein n=1 Tax=Acidisphaera sp. S103 TaxID=1747223 RepID=UPI00131C7A92|nr:heme-binding protein [Acidisphaera sp. S103]
MSLLDFTFRPVNVPQYKSDAFPDTLGPLADLPGKWQGTGFNQIWRPHHATSTDPAGQDRFLELNLTTETLEFEEISGPIPNRGFLQGDISMFGVTYLQKVSDVVSGGIHIEPGIWAVVPKTTNPPEGNTVARLASIPHGTTILAQGTAVAKDGAPLISPASITPFAIGNPSRTVLFPETNLSKPTPFRQVSNDSITQEMVDNPNSVLSSALQNQVPVRTIALLISTTAPSPISGGGTDGTAFLQGSATEGPNASPASMSAIFWIEKVAPKDGGLEFLQLQYTQTVLLNFNGLSWPHVSVATLRKV